jgi:hypothetical protein
MDAKLACHIERRVWENREIFLRLREKATRGLRRLHNEELPDFYCLPDVIRVMKSRRMGWIGNALFRGKCTDRERKRKDAVWKI